MSFPFLPVCRFVSEGQRVHVIKEGTSKIYTVVVAAGRLARLKNEETDECFWMEVEWLADVEATNLRKQEIAAAVALERMGLDPLEVVKRGRPDADDT